MENRRRAPTEQINGITDFPTRSNSEHPGPNLFDWWRREPQSGVLVPALGRNTPRTIRLTSMSTPSTLVRSLIGHGGRHSSGQHSIGISLYQQGHLVVFSLPPRLSAGSGVGGSQPAIH